MTEVKKICWTCKKEFKQRPYRSSTFCGRKCAIKKFRRNEYNRYLEGKSGEAKQPTFSTMYSLEWKKESDIAGLDITKERYRE